MPRFFNPPSVFAPYSAYSHGVEVPTGARTIYFSGQVGNAPDGAIPEDFASQMRNVFANIEFILAEADMEFKNLVKLTSFMIRREDLEPSRVLRNELLKGNEPAHTLLFVSGLANPAFLIEVEGFAAAE